MTFGILALGFPVSEDLWGFAAFGGSQSHFLPYLPYLNAFLRWRLASWLWGSLFRKIWGVSQPLGAHCLTFFLIFPILMHSLGDVWHPGSGVPCFGGFGGFRSLWGLTVSLSSLFLPYLPYLNAFLRWRLASWLWGSLFRRIWGVSQPLGAHSLTFFLIFPILMHSLGDVWHPGSGVPCFGGLGGFAAFGGSQSHFLPYFFLIFPILMHSLGDVWHPGSGVPCFGGFGGFRSLWGLTVSLSSLPYLHAFLRWRLASWLWGSLFRRIWGVSQPLGAHSLTFFLIFPILMHSLGDVWHPGSGVPCFGGFGGFRSLWELTVSLSSLSSLS